MSKPVNPRRHPQAHLAEDLLFLGADGRRMRFFSHPECLSAGDRQVLADVRQCLTSGNSASDKVANYLEALRSSDHVAYQRFFRRAIGWVEGAHYCRDTQYLRLTGAECVVRFLREHPEEFKEAA